MLSSPPSYHRDRILQGFLPPTKTENPKKEKNVTFSQIANRVMGLKEIRELHKRSGSRTRWSVTAPPKNFQTTPQTLPENFQSIPA
jgi:hypothetical protein